MNESDLIQVFSSGPLLILLLAPLPIISYLLFKTIKSPHRNERFAPMVLLLFLDLLATLPWVGAILVWTGAMK